MHERDPVRLFDLKSRFCLQHPPPLMPSFSQYSVADQRQWKQSSPADVDKVSTHTLLPGFLVPHSRSSEIRAPLISLRL